MNPLQQADRSGAQESRRRSQGAQGRGGDDVGARGDGDVALQQPGARDVVEGGDASLKPLATWVPDLCAPRLPADVDRQRRPRRVLGVELLLPAGLPHRDDAEPRASTSCRSTRSRGRSSSSSARSTRSRRGRSPPTARTSTVCIWRARAGTPTTAAGVALEGALHPAPRPPPPPRRQPRAARERDYVCPLYKTLARSARCRRRATRPTRDGVRDPLRPTAGALDQAGSRGDHGAKILVQLKSVITTAWRAANARTDVEGEG